uniref:Uncharacterized protein n=1 Tax=Salix viminalis TaxID=40686 RepID=A0A6N2KGS0_SALVM
MRADGGCDCSCRGWEADLSSGQRGWPLLKAVWVNWRQMVLLKEEEMRGRRCRGAGHRRLERRLAKKGE